jgi:hypothetical protein
MRKTHIPQSGYADSVFSPGVRSVATPDDLLVQLDEEKPHAAVVPAEQSTPDRSPASRKSKRAQTSPDARVHRKNVNLAPASHRRALTIQAFDILLAAMRSRIADSV